MHAAIAYTKVSKLIHRIRRDLVERKRDVLHVLEQYERTVKPSFAQFILPTKQFAHIIVRTCLRAMVKVNCNAVD